MTELSFETAVLTCNFVDITEQEALVQHITLSPSGVGSITFYLPVVIEAEMLDET